MKILRSKGKAVHKTYKPLPILPIQCSIVRVIQNKGHNEAFNKCIGKTYNVVSISTWGLSTMVALDCSKDLGGGYEITWWDIDEVEIIK